MAPSGSAAVVPVLVKMHISGHAVGFLRQNASPPDVVMKARKARRVGALSPEGPQRREGAA